MQSKLSNFQLCALVSGRHILFPRNRSLHTRQVDLTIDRKQNLPFIERLFEWNARIPGNADSSGKPDRAVHFAIFRGESNCTVQKD